MFVLTIIFWFQELEKKVTMLEQQVLSLKQQLNEAQTSATQTEEAAKLKEQVISMQERIAEADAMVNILNSMPPGILIEQWGIFLLSDDLFLSLICS